MFIEANQVKKGMKLELDKVPYNAVNVDYVKPGKGQAFVRTKLKNLKTGAVTEKTFKSNEKVSLADIEETSMRLLYRDGEDAVFMDDNTFEQVTITAQVLQDHLKWLKEDLVYDIIFYKGEAIDFMPPNFIVYKIVETSPGERGNTASGRVLKPGKTDTGIEVLIPIFIQEGDEVKVDTRTGEYDSRA